jgi:hypothetical protein
MSQILSLSRESVSVCSFLHCLNSHCYSESDRLLLVSLALWHGRFRDFLVKVIYSQLVAETLSP